jgi:predicted GNAT family N-acyltransferase
LVIVAGCESEREAVFRFRYSVYVEELQRGVGTVDELHRWVRDPEDDDPTTLLLYTTAGDGTVTGTARLRGWSPRAVPEAISDRYATARFDGIDGLGMAEVGRVMVRPDQRGHDGLVALACACYQLAGAELGADLVFLTCLPGLVRHYERTGFRTYAAPLVLTTDGVTVPMVLVLSDRWYLESVDSFLVPLVGAFYGAGGRPAVDIGPWAGLFDADSAQVELDAASVWGRVWQLRAAAAVPGFLDALRLPSQIQPRHHRLG